MNSVSYDIVDLLEQSSVGFTFGQDLFIGRQPADPLNCVTLYDSSSATPASTYAGGDYMYESIQVIVRDTDYQQAFTVADRLKNALHNKVPGFINGTYYTLIRLSSGPAVIEYDEKGAIHLSINYAIQRTDDTKIILMNMGAIQFFDAYDDLPEDGETNTAYLIKEEKSMYVWDGTEQIYLKWTKECVDEAPEDGKTYGRKNAGWAEVEASGGGGYEKQTLTEADPTTWDAASGNYAVLEITDDRTLSFPDNVETSKKYILDLIQGAGGSHTLTFDGNYNASNGGTASDITQSTTEGRRDRYEFFAVSETVLQLINMTTNYTD